MNSVDMSPGAITHRLAEVSRLRDLEKKQGTAVDMSPRAVTLRLVTVSRLRDLCLALVRSPTEV